MTRHTIFLSWSGHLSKYIAEALHDWLPQLLPQVQPFMSSEDIDKGTRWNRELVVQLQRARFGVVCLTPDNLNAPWLLFESGAIFNALDSRLFTLLYRLEDRHVPFPLAMFQHATTSGDDVLKLIKSLNRALDNDGLEDSRLDRGFKKWWPDLEIKLKQPPAPVLAALPKINLEEEQHKMLTEIVTTVRETARRLEDDDGFFSEPEDMHDLRGYFIDQLKPILQHVGIQWHAISTLLDNETLRIQAVKPQRYYTVSFKSIVEYVFGYKSRRSLIGEARLRTGGTPGRPPEYNS